MNEREPLPELVPLTPAELAALEPLFVWLERAVKSCSFARSAPDWAPVS